jgi:Flp pilus assembly pilin Flp
MGTDEQYCDTDVERLYLSGGASLKYQIKEENKMKHFIINFWSNESGQDLIEYTLLMAFIALASAAIFIGAGGSVSTIWGTASTNLSTAAS